MKPWGWILLLSAAGMLIVGCSTSSPGAPASQRSVPDAMRQYGCPSCHVIPGVPGASGHVGPSLAGVAQRSYLAGTLPNTPENLASWVMHPQHLRPGTAMPEMGVTERDAHRIVEFLERIR
jgi:cytochrome c